MAESMAEAIRAGHLHLDLRGKKKLDDLDKLSVRRDYSSRKKELSSAAADSSSGRGH